MDVDEKEKSDVDDMDSDDSDNEEELEALAQTLENKVCENVYLYQSHVELINVLKQLADLDRLRTARNRMAKEFPLTPELWIDWLEDEIKIASTDEENKAVLKLFDRAVKDYLSVELWLKYLEFVKDYFGCNTDFGVAEVRKVCERSLVAGGLHIVKGSLLWNSYIEYEEERLKIIEENSESALNQLKLIGNLYKRLLSCPLVDIEDNFKKFCTWFEEKAVKSDSAIIDKKVVENIYNKSRIKLLTLKDYEDALISGSDHTLQHYKEYLEYEKSKDGSPVRVQFLYERMICDFCLHEEIWLEYIHFLSSVLKNSDMVMELIQRALRNCPWSCHLHQAHIIFLEKYHSSHEIIRGAFEQAVGSGLQISEDFRDIWMTFLEYLRRRLDEPDISKDDENKRFEELVANFAKAVEFLSELEGSDPECEVTQFWARVEAIYGKNMEKSRNIWNDIISSYNSESSELWLEYIHIERTFGDSKHLRRLYGRALQKTNDFPEKIAKSWLNYERDEGTLESYETCLEKIKFRLQQVKEQREREFAERNAEAEEAKEVARGKFKRQSLRSKKDKRQENYSDRERNDRSTGCKRKFESGVHETKVVEKKSKREENQDLVEKLLDEEKSHGVTVVHDSSKDNRTVFVSNLDFSTEEATIRDVFQTCGEITDLRLVKDYKGRSKGYCYVEFEKPTDAANALRKDRTLINTRPMYVSKCDPDKDTRERVFRYSSTMEKNKLFVRGLPFTTTENDLKQLFGKFGIIRDVRLVTYRNGHSKGLAYVDYEDEASAAQAILKTDGLLIGDKQISVAISNPPSRKTEMLTPQINSLGGGAKQMGPRGRGRTQLSFVPRSVHFNPPSHPTQSMASLSLKSPQPSE
ncbi:UNVERIFIED_CONTAM: hypothetical protein PYX00_005061 [Menopon gallinae]|uniref:RRM domain-containing protein n=1 Tax=Menopon gallinae TaxID=328185 RepID=A0AAW2HR26_9NEOP